MKLDCYLLNTYYPELDGPGPVLYKNFLEQADTAEASGFDTAWYTEHHFRTFGGMTPSVTALMSAVAQRTRRIRLGSAVVILPLHHPLAVAEEMAVLDILSEGRIELGVGRGMEAFEYKVFGSDFAKAQEKLEEQIQIIRAAWTQHPFTWHGRMYDFPVPMEILPSPVQQPHPPIWMSAVFSEAHYRWIGLQGFNLMTLSWVQPNLARARALINIYREALQEAGHDPATRDIMAMYPTYCGETPAQAKKDVELHWENWHRFAIEEVKHHPEPVRKAVSRMNYDVMAGENRGIFGDPAMCEASLKHIGEELGVTHIAGVYHFGGLAQERVLASMRRLGSEVAPALGQAQRVRPCPPSTTSV